jgi:hypothetical protein
MPVCFDERRAGCSGVNKLVIITGAGHVDCEKMIRECLTARETVDIIKVVNVFEEKPEGHVWTEEEKEEVRRLAKRLHDDAQRNRDLHDTEVATERRQKKMLYCIIIVVLVIVVIVLACLCKMCL